MFLVGAESIAAASRRDLNRLQRSQSGPPKLDASLLRASPVDVPVAETTIPVLAPSAEESIGKLAQLQGDLKAHRRGLATAKSAMTSATALRGKEIQKAEF